MNVKTPLAIAAAVVLIIVAVTIALYVVVVKVPSDLAYKTAEGVRQTFNFTPQVRLASIRCFSPPLWWRSYLSWTCCLPGLAV